MAAMEGESDVTDSQAIGEEERGDSKKWNDQKTEKLIEQLQKYPCLYDSTLKAYHDRNLRKKSFESLSKELEVSESDIKAKLKSLRATFGRERRKKKKKKPTGTGVDDITDKPTWKFFESLRFLEDFIIPKNSTSSMEDKDDYDEEAESEDFDKEELAVKDTKRKLPYNKEPQSKKARIDKKEEILLDSAITYSSSSKKGSEIIDDEHDIFGKYLANELRSIKDAKLLRWIKWSIQNTLYTAHFGGMPHQIGRPIPFSPTTSSPTYSGYSMSPPPMAQIWNNSGYTTDSDQPLTH